MESCIQSFLSLQLKLVECSLKAPACLSSLLQSLIRHSLSAIWLRRCLDVRTHDYYVFDSQRSIHHFHHPFKASQAPPRSTQTLYLSPCVCLPEACLGRFSGKFALGSKYVQAEDSGRAVLCLAQSLPFACYDLGCSQI